MPWRPAPGTSWQWQLTQPVDVSVEAEVFDVDLFETPPETIAELKRRGRKVICYFSAGSLEPWRPDADAFPEEIIGNPLEDWPEERWLDIRRLDLLAPIVRARLDLAVRKGCDGVEPDDVDGYLHDTGFPITYGDQLRYNVWLSLEAHKRGLSIGLKNDPEQAEELELFFDWALVEECFEYGECEAYRVFVRRGKAVFAVEYNLSPEEFCAEAAELGFSALRKRQELDAWRIPCRSVLDFR
ncbi:endo alpha-1,4 polygalactosaminidase (plasmid) [Thermosulfurimonas sp. F29]|nr:endo alpha-1,4 polygalactosaminidase [Thermosulfurimonas sp. F29]